MLKPYVCVACEKVIVDQDGVASLIGLFSKILFTPNFADEEIPKNAVAPKTWAIFSSWDIEPGDEKKEWFFCAQMFYPDGSPFVEIKSKINVEAGKRAQVKSDVMGFPVGQPGHHAVRCWIEQSDGTKYPPVEFIIELEKLAVLAAPK